MKIWYIVMCSTVMVSRAFQDAYIYIYIYMLTVQKNHYIAMVQTSVNVYIGISHTIAL
jgi:hypothetical protein